MRPFRELGFVETTNSQLKREWGERIKDDRKRTEKGEEEKEITYEIDMRMIILSVMVPRRSVFKRGEREGRGGVTGRGRDMNV